MNKIKCLIVMAFLLVIMVCALAARNGDAKDSLVLMNELHERQNTVFTDANDELFKLGKTIWQRTFGESEYYLAPSATNIEQYYARIERKDNKSKNIKKSQFRIVRVALNELSKSKLREFGIHVPSYYSSDQVLVTLPIIDIEELDSYGLILETITDYGKKMVYQPQSQNDSRATIWQEG